MQVFKLFFLILRRYIGNGIMYIAIFLGICLGIIVPQMTAQDENGGYTAAKCNLVIFDYDESDLSKALTAYLESNHNPKTIKDDSWETIQDELYAANVDCILILKEGYAAAFAMGNGEEYFEFYSIPDSMGAVLVEQHIHSYLSVVNTYLQAGFPETEAANKALSVTGKSVELIDSEPVQASEGPLHYFFKYMSWIFVAISINCFSLTLRSINKKGVQERISCSSQKFVQINLEIMLAIVMAGFAICGICVLAAVSVFPQEMAAEGAGYYILNAFCIMSVALALTFLVSKLTDNEQVISLLSNLIGLGMSFLCGIFVPLEFLSEGIIKVAHFLPAYWNVRAIQVIDTFTPAAVPELFSYMGIQLLFAMAIVCAALLVARGKQVVRE